MGTTSKEVNTFCRHYIAKNMETVWGVFETNIFILSRTMFHLVTQRRRDFKLVLTEINNRVRTVNSKTEKDKKQLFLKTVQQSEVFSACRYSILLMFSPPTGMAWTFQHSY